MSPFIFSSGSIFGGKKKRVVVYVDRPESIVFLPVAVDTSVRIYDDFLRLLFLHAHREASALANDIPEESGHFRFLSAACLGKINIIILRGQWV